MVRVVNSENTGLPCPDGRKREGEQIVPENRINTLGGYGRFQVTRGGRQLIRYASFFIGACGTGVKMNNGYFPSPVISSVSVKISFTVQPGDRTKAEYESICYIF